MANERRWLAVLQAFSANGTAQGIITVIDTKGFYVKQSVSVSSTTKPSLLLEIKRIDGSTTIHVGPPGDINARKDLSAYLVADGAQVFAPEQFKTKVREEDQTSASWEAEPINARRVFIVDSYGNPANLNGGGSSSSGGLAPADFDDVKIIRNSSGDPIQYQFYLSNVSVGNINVTYDAFGASEYKKA